MVFLHKFVSSRLSGLGKWNLYVKLSFTFDSHRSNVHCERPEHTRQQIAATRRSNKFRHVNRRILAKICRPNMSHKIKLVKFSAIYSVYKILSRRHLFQFRSAAPKPIAAVSRCDPSHETYKIHFPSTFQSHNFQWAIFIHGLQALHRAILTLSCWLTVDLAVVFVFLPGLTYERSSFYFLFVSRFSSLHPSLSVSNKPFFFLPFFPCVCGVSPCWRYTIAASKCRPK